MKRMLWPLAVVIVPAILGAAGLLVAHAAPPAPPETAALHPAASPAPAPTTTPRTARTPRPAIRPRPQHTGPWAVAAAYYQDISARKYAAAWALISAGLATGQTYQQFVAGYACTGTEQPTKLGQTRHRVRFTLTVTSTCTGATQYYTGTDTIHRGKITAAQVTRTG